MTRRSHAIQEEQLQKALVLFGGLPRRAIMFHTSISIPKEYITGSLRPNRLSWYAEVSSGQPAAPKEWPTSRRSLGSPARSTFRFRWAWMRRRGVGHSFVLFLLVGWSPPVEETAETPRLPCQTVAAPWAHWGCWRSEGSSIGGVFHLPSHQIGILEQSWDDSQQVKSALRSLY